MTSRGPFEVVSSREVYRNKWLHLREDSVLRPGGTQGLFGIVEMVAGSSVLALDGEDYVYLGREYKYGVGMYSLETISGALNEGETPLDAARRELQEELGLAADDWTDLGTVNPFTTVVRSPNHMFLARALRRVAPSPDPGELVELVHMPFAVALGMVERGEITHAASCVAILKTARLLGR